MNVVINSVRKTFDLINTKGSFINEIEEKTTDIDITGTSVLTQT